MRCVLPVWQLVCRVKCIDVFSGDLILLVYLFSFYVRLPSGVSVFNYIWCTFELVSSIFILFVFVRWRVSELPSSMANTVVNVISDSSSESALVNIYMTDMEESVPQFSNINSSFVRSNAPVESLL